MLLDSLLRFSNAQLITVDAISTNVIDLGPLGGATANLIRDIAAGEVLHLSIQVAVTLLASGGAAELTVSLESDSTENLATSATVHWTSVANAKAVLVAGFWIAKGIIIPPGNYERYLGLRYNATTNDFTAGSISAWLHKGRYDDRTYRSGYATGVN